MTSTVQKPRISLSIILRFIKNNWPAFALMGMAVLSKGVGFLKNTLIAYFFGASHQADLLGLLIFPTDFVTSFLVNNTIITALTIYFAKKENDKNEVFWRTFHFYRVVLIIAAVGLSISTIFTYPEIPWYLAVLSALPGVLYGLAGIIQSYLNYNRVFLWPGAQELLGNIFLLLGIVLAAKFGLGAYVVVLIGTGFLRIAVQIPNLRTYLKKSGHKIRDLLGWPQVTFEKSLLIFVGPLLFTFILSGIPGFLILHKLSTSGEGMIAAYNYANKIIGFFNPIFVIPITTYLIPTMQRRIQEGRQSNSLNTLALLFISVSSVSFALLMLFEPQLLISIIYAHGKFDTEALLLTSKFLQYQSFATVGYALMYYIVQLTLLGNKSKRLILSYIVGTIVIIASLYMLPFAPFVTVGIALTLGVFASIAVLVW